MDISSLPSSANKFTSTMCVEMVSDDDKCVFPPVKK